MKNKTHIEKKSATKAEAVSRHKNYRSRAVQIGRDFDELVLDIYEVVARNEHVLLGLTEKEYAAYIFEGVRSESYAFRVALQAKKLSHLPRKQLAAIKEGKRQSLAEAFRDLGVGSKTEDLVEMAKDSKIGVEKFAETVKARKFHPDEHREPLVTVSARVEAPVEEKWGRALAIVAQALSGDGVAVVTPSEIYEAIADGILEKTMTALIEFLPHASEPEEVAT